MADPKKPRELQGIPDDVTVRVGNWPCSDCPMESRPKFLALPTKSVPDPQSVKDMMR